MRLTQLTRAPLLTYDVLTYVSHMGKPSQFPPGPITSQTVEGREQFRKLFKPWQRQWSQPGLLKLAEAVLGDKVIHSSQISGFATGTLRDPAPKVLLALGKLNVALAEKSYPTGLGKLVEGKEPMRTTTGKVLGPAELFLAFVGELDLGLPDVQEIPMEHEAAVSKDLGRHLRMAFSAKGIDWHVEDHQRLVKAAPALEGLLGGQTVNGEEVVRDLPKVAELLSTNEAELWDVIQLTLSKHLPE